MSCRCLTCGVRVFGTPVALAATLNTEHGGHRFGPVRRATIRELVELVMRER